MNVMELRKNNELNHVSPNSVDFYLALFPDVQKSARQICGPN